MSAKSGAPLQPGATQPEHDGVAHEAEQQCPCHVHTYERMEKCSQRVGHKGICTMVKVKLRRRFTEAQLTTLLERMARLVAREAAKVMCQYCAAGHGHLVNRSGFYVCKAVKLYDQLTPEKLQQLREAVERP